MTKVGLPFADRLEAGNLLADELRRRKLSRDCIVLALPRGGVPVGYAVAQKLGAALDVIVVRKLGVPWQPELAMGALTASIQVLDDRTIDGLSISAEEVERVINAERREIERREWLYRSGRAALDLRGRNVLLVDDGLATGSTMMAAARHVKALQPARLFIAVPVASGDACRRMRMEADECIALATPQPFYAVGQWYRNFDEVGDAEVQRLLAESRRTVGSVGIGKAG